MHCTLHIAHPHVTQTRPREKNATDNVDLRMRGDKFIVRGKSIKDQDQIMSDDIGSLMRSDGSLQTDLTREVFRRTLEKIYYDKENKTIEKKTKGQKKGGPEEVCPNRPNLK